MKKQYSSGSLNTCLCNKGPLTEDHLVKVHSRTVCKLYLYHIGNTGTIRLLDPLMDPDFKKFSHQMNVIFNKVWHNTFFSIH